MKISNLITVLRIVLAPIFIYVFFLVDSLADAKIILLVILWLLFFLIEISDILDGLVARSLRQVTDLGKVLDPFADSLSRLSYFLCLMVAGIMPLWIFVLILYRDLWLSFLRLLVMKKGISMGSRLLGKIKAWIYALAGGYGLFVFSEARLLIFRIDFSIIQLLNLVIYSLVVVVAIGSAVEYTGHVIREKS
jgi:CDP-diacylglycerol--glycerol-3-phosphate 3-phosphatidyltransferase